VIPQDFIQQLLARVDIVEVIDRHVKLKKSGQNYSACCPFHSEKTASFSVSPTKQFYHCFGCGAHGTAVGFLMEYNGMGFREAVEELAVSVGMALPAEANRQEALEKARENATLTEVMASAAAFYRRSLKASPRAIDYLKRRGLTGEIAAAFGLGYAPDDWQGLKAAVDDYSVAALKECGLVIDSEEGRRYDRFRDRVMFPIWDQRGGVIGFGGRVIDAGEPKYLNSPETALFEKGRELYGLFQARRTIRDTGTVIVVEGYMDVVALAQAGVGNAVATLGTATTPMHVEKLLRLADNLVFCFDGDKAGQRAAWRALEQSLPVLQDGKDVRFLFLPEEDDPDTYVRRLGKEAFLDAQAKATPLSQYLLDQLKAQVDLSSDEGRARLVNLAKPLVVQVAAPTVALLMRRKLAELSGLGAIEVERLVPLAPSLANLTAASAGVATGQRGTLGEAGPGASGTRGKFVRGGGPPRGAPAPRVRAPAAGLAVQIIARMLLRPSLALQFDLASDAEGDAALKAAERVAEFIRDHDGEVLHPAAVVEYFRETAEEPFLSQASRLLSEVDVDRLDLDAEFHGALDRLRAEAAVAAKRAETLRRARELGID
jgi:DNA primase